MEEERTLIEEIEEYLTVDLACRTVKQWLSDAGVVSDPSAVIMDLAHSNRIPVGRAAEIIADCNSGGEPCEPQF